MVSGTPLSNELGLPDDFSTDDVKEEHIQAFNKQQREERAETKVQVQRERDRWDKDLEVVSGYIEQAVEDCPHARKVIERADSTFHDQLAALVKAFGAQDQESLASNILKLVHLRFQSGTAHEHAVRYGNIVDKLLAPYSDGGCDGKISIAELAKILWIPTLQDFSVFSDYLKMVNSRTQDESKKDSL